MQGISAVQCRIYEDAEIEAELCSYKKDKDLSEGVHIRYTHAYLYIYIYLYRISIPLNMVLSHKLATPCKDWRRWMRRSCWSIKVQARFGDVQIRPSFRGIVVAWIVLLWTIWRRLGRIIVWIRLRGSLRRLRFICHWKENVVIESFIHTVALMVPYSLGVSMVEKESIQKSRFPLPSTNIFMLNLFVLLFYLCYFVLWVRLVKFTRGGNCLAHGATSDKSQKVHYFCRMMQSWKDWDRVSHPLHMQEEYILQMLSMLSRTQTWWQHDQSLFRWACHRLGGRCNRAEMDVVIYYSSRKMCTLSMGRWRESS